MRMLTRALRGVLSIALASALLPAAPSRGREARGADDADRPGHRHDRRIDPCERLLGRLGETRIPRERCRRAGSSSGVAKGDFNGDGFADLAVGMPNEDTPSSAPNAGAVIVIYGSANGLTATDAAVPASQFWSQNSPGVPDGSQTNEEFGSALAAGDFNDDGFSDLAIGTPGERLADGAGARLGPAGAVTVLYGSAGGITTSSAAGVPPPRMLSFVDVEDRRGVDYGVALSANGDADVPAGFSFGSALAWGDFDGDGIGDLAVGSPDQGLGSGFGFVTEVGAVAVFLGSEDAGLVTDGSQAWSQATPGVRGTSEANDHFGASLAGGNFDGDAFGDLAIGIPDQDDADGVPDAGAVATLFGGAGGLTTANDLLDDQIFFLGLNPAVPGTPAPNDRLGWSLAAGDFDGDGRSDLVLGAPYKDIVDRVNGGAVFIRLGSAQNTPPPAIQFFHQDLIFGPSISPLLESPTETGDLFGYALAAGDFNADGRADLAIGVPFEDVLVDRGRFFESVVDAGEVNVLYGSAAGLSPSGRAPQQFHQNTINVEGDAGAGDRFGSSLTAWNFGRNEVVPNPGTFPIVVSTPDLAIGVPLEEVSGITNAGGVNVLYGSTAANGLRTTDDQFWSQSSAGVPGGPETSDSFGSALY
jgi:hypothetical protein